jgi:hypothetical protein
MGAGLLTDPEMSAFWITIDVLAAALSLRYVVPQLDENTLGIAIMIGIAVLPFRLLPGY